MRTKNCVHCGDAVVLADQGERVTQGETPREHMERTGHVHIHEPKPMVCKHCGNVWMYSGGADRITCPNCRGKVRPEEAAILAGSHSTPS